MARKFLVWNKKRGDRQSGSRILGGIYAVVFFALFLLVGVILLASLITYQIQATAMGESGYSIVVFVVQLLTLSAIIGVSLFQISNLVWIWGASAERRSAMVNSASRLRVVSERTQMDYPSVPSGENITNSPGTHLAYRLPVIQVPTLQFFVSATICMTLCIVVSGLVVTLWSQMHQGHYNWLVICLTLVFIGAAGWSIYYFLRDLLLHSKLGPTYMEISDHPIFPGKSYRVHLCQAGHLCISSLELKLICREEATFQEGTDVRTESKIVREIDVFDDATVHVLPEKPYEVEAEISIPVDAMHSFQSTSNLISWNFIVRGSVTGWPPFERRFRVVVHPNSTPA